MVWWLMLACGGPLALNFEAVPHDSTLSRVSDFAFFPDGSRDLMVVDIDGGFAWMRLTDNSAETVLEGTIPDVYAEGVAGLVGLEFDPDFSTNRFFYVGMTDLPTEGLLRRYTLVDDDVEATLASGVEILRVGDEQSRLPHNISSFDFDESGDMWLFIGDKGVPEAAADPQDLRGKLVRITPSREPGVGGYTVPDNGPPIADGANPAILAQGFRSPWRGIRHNDRWYVSDVGADLGEEINLVDLNGGRNFGWPAAEGPCRRDCSGLVDPFVVYSHVPADRFILEDPQASTSERRAAYAAWVHQSGTPDPYQGKWNNVLLFGDVYAGFLRGIRLGFLGGRSWHVGHLEGATAWDQGPDGYVYAFTIEGLPLDEVSQPSGFYRAVLAER